MGKSLAGGIQTGDVGVSPVGILERRADGAAGRNIVVKIVEVKNSDPIGSVKIHPVQCKPGENRERQGGIQLREIP